MHLWMIREGVSFLGSWTRLSLLKARRVGSQQALIAFVRRAATKFCAFSGALLPPGSTALDGVCELDLQ